MVFKKRENRRIRGKTSRSKGEKQQPTQPLHGVDARIRTRAALVGEECSYHYRATLAPLTGSLRRPADQQARRLWVRDWEEQRKKSASEAVDKTSEVVVRGGGRSIFFPVPFPRLPLGSVHWRFFFFAFFFQFLAWSQT